MPPSASTKISTRALTGQCKYRVVKIYANIVNLAEGIAPLFFWCKFGANPRNQPLQYGTKCDISGFFLSRVLGILEKKQR